MYRERMDLFDKVLGLNAYLHQPVRKLSLGERMRCDLAASLLHRPPLLFLDEPTIGLDIVAKANVREFLQEINAPRRHDGPPDDARPRRTSRRSAGASS